MHFDFKARSRGRRTVAALVGGGVLSVGAVAGVLPSLGATASATARKAAPVLQAINVPKYPACSGTRRAARFTSSRTRPAEGSIARANACSSGSRCT